MDGEAFFSRGGAGKDSKFVERGGPGRGTPPPRGEGSPRGGASIPVCDTSFTPRRVAQGHHTHPLRCNTILAITRIYVSLIWFQPDYHRPLYYTVDCVFCSVFLFPYTFATWFCSSAVLLFPCFPTFGRLQQWKTIVNSTPHKCRWNSNIRRKPLSKPCYPALSSQKSRKWKYLTTSRLEICQKIYTTGFSSQKFYTLKETA